MTVGRRLLFSLVTLTLVFGVIEAGCWIAWRVLETRAMRVRTEMGTEALKSNGINFMMKSDPLLGFTLQPNHPVPGTNSVGFAQRYEVPVARTAGKLRIVTMGESTTQGHGPDRGNYPYHLKQLLDDPSLGGAPAEIINAGVAGWFSEQVALYAERKVAAYKPDVVIFYAGWNDFQSYTPYGVPPPMSVFHVQYGNPYRIQSDFPIKTVVFAVAAYEALLRDTATSRPPATRQPDGYAGAPEDQYRFLFANLDQAIAALRRGNPEVKIVVSTLVARWPDGTRADFDAPQGHVWWMKQEPQVDPAGAERAMRRFNEAVRAYARSRKLVLIDVEQAYSGLDRRKLLWDFAHMTDEGYELMANVIYDSLVKQQVISGRAPPKLPELLSKYAKPRPNVKQE
jgi:lysophospholipase L1-like esterase